MIGESVPKWEKGISMVQRIRAITPQPPNLLKPPLWKRIPGWVYAAIVVFSILITILEGYPWLSIHEGILLDPQNPYSELFSLSNAGYVPISDLSATCSVSVEAGNVSLRNVGARFNHFAGYLTHGASATIPCFRTIATNGTPLSDADLNITIAYSYYPFTFKSLRRHQAFKFRAIKSLDGSLHWTFLS